ncbi:3'-5' exonuclease [Rathayibacter tanaceti]|uniref:DNA polymerase III PolC-type n=2 Tax=Rathayibacter tanaceti TaxID=1671680 RepID=A0A166IPW9_9MICO|nr:3'-5' exonuclease [Rathayibacter tanaceti]KZX22733.1 DNA polymerase III PolC-type [Rathayibacter tanaceti]QHC55920.1 DNA polymerase III subunit epsilon [Rathayibacter tanaceti]TCO39245.1 DNA polymerase-3 subunit epsilon [Rathayibacter tanaceti]
MPIDFTAIDFETANSHGASACSVGLVKVRDGRVVDRAGWLIRPPLGFDDFLEWNTRIHGIRKTDVHAAPGWAEQFTDLAAFAGDDVFVAHNAGFDMGVIRAACAATALEHPEYDYFCSLQLARKTYELDSYRLPAVAMAAGFEDFRHHDASADAEACAAIVVHAAQRHGATGLAELGELAGVTMKRLRPKAPVAV